MENRITTHKREFKINDTTVVFNFSDQIFISNLFKFMYIFDEVPNFEESKNSKKMREQIDKLNAFLLGVKKVFEDLFGIGSCKKVFDCELPSMDTFIEFLYLAMPLIEECYEAKDENQKRLMSQFSKYSNRQQRRLANRR